MPDTYQPSDEQIDALCTAEAALFVGDEDYLATKRFVAHPAFQAIIRAAQAEAWNKGHRDGWDDRNSDFLCGWIPSGYSADSRNPYRESADV